MAEQKKVLADLKFDAPRLPVHADEALHAPNPTDIDWAETSWWAFATEDGGIGGWFYLLTRRNLGVATLGIFVWDRTATAQYDFPYCKQFTHLPLAEDFDLIDGKFPQISAALSVEEPFKAYRVSYAEGEALSFDLRLTGLVDPQPVGVSESTGHLDQLLWAKGSLKLEGKVHTIDGPAMRDRTWSTRPEASVGQYNCYAWGASKTEGFHLMAMENPEGDPLFSAGFLWRDGSVSSVKTVKRSVEKRAPDGQPLLVSITLEDQLGRTLTVTSEPLSAGAILAFTGYLCWCSVMDWKTAGGQLLRGEDHDTWPYLLWRKLRLEGKKLPPL